MNELTTDEHGWTQMDTDKTKKNETQHFQREKIENAASLRKFLTLIRFYAGGTGGRPFSLWLSAFIWG